MIGLKRMSCQWDEAVDTIGRIRISATKVYEFMSSEDADYCADNKPAMAMIASSITFYDISRRIK